MKLQTSRIEFISSEILSILESEKFIVVKDQENAFNFIQNVITQDLLVEDKLDEEVREILDQHIDKIDQDRIQYHEMFRMVKDKLVKEKNLIL